MAARNRKAELAPFRIDPVFTARVWGFRDLRPWYDRVAEGDPIGEVWLTGDECPIATGPTPAKSWARSSATKAPRCSGLMRRQAGLAFAD